MTDERDGYEGNDCMNIVFNIIATVALIAISSSCKQRNYNQASYSSDQVITLCKAESAGVIPSGQRGKANQRISCMGSCEGDDYSSRRFYISDSTVVAGIEFEAKYKSGVSLRNLFVFDSQLPIAELTKQIQLENTETQRAIASYGLDTTQIDEIVIPSEHRILLFPGTRASLSQAGLLDGGSLDCRGQPIDGSQLKSEFKQQNLNQIKRAATVQRPN